MAFATVAVVSGIISTGLGIFGDRTLGIDAYNMWAIKARAVFFAGSFAPLLAGCCDKVNYPMLFPLQAWWTYRHLEYFNDWWDQIMGFLF